MSQLREDAPEANAAAAGAGWVERCSRRLIRRAARTAPAPLAERLEEEWQADLATRRSAASRLRFALGCCWATRVIAREHFAPIPAAGAAVCAKPAGAKLAFLHPGPQTRLLSRRSIALLVVVCLHIAVFYALLSGLAYKITRVIPTDFQTHIIDQPRPREILPVLPTPPRLAPRLADRVFVPPDLPPVQDLPEKSNLAPQPVDPMPRATSTADSQLAPHVMPPHVVDRVQGGPGSGFPNPDEYYPMMARHLQEEGVATLRVCVDPRGRLTSDPTTIESTGSARLDAGALELARAGSGHYRPSLEDGRPVNSCYAFRVRFQLRN